MNWLKSVKFKLTAIYSAVLVAVLVMSGFISWAMLSYGLFHNLKESLAADAEKVRNIILQNGSEDLDSFLADLEDNPDESFFIYDTESKDVYGSGSSLTMIQAALSNINGHFGAGSQTMNSPDGSSRLYITTLDIVAAPEKLLVVTSNTGYISSALDFYKNSLFAAIPLALAVAGASGYALASHSMRQVKAIRLTAEGIDPAKMTDRIPVRGNDELGQLSGILNTTFDRIHGFIARQRQFTEDATHDLRAPLSNIKAQTSLALERDRPWKYYREALVSIEEDTEQMESMVEDLLTLASTDTVPNSEYSTHFDLSNAMDDVCDGWEAPCAKKGIALERCIQQDIWTTGEPLDLHRIADNLIENAVKATSKGGVTFTMTESSGMITITVADTGCGIPPDQLEKIFWRFYRVDRNAAGNGLGLPIVEGIAQMYGGRVEVESEVGEGTTFRVFLPVRPKR